MAEIDPEKINDLIEKLSITPLNGTCEFLLCNKTPQEWDVQITNGGAKFFYSDGSDYTDGPKPLGLRTGDCYSFYSNDGEKCVKQIFLAINLYVPGEGENTMTYTGEMASEDECWTRDGVELGQRMTVQREQIGTKNFMPRLAFKRSWQ